MACGGDRLDGSRAFISSDTNNPPSFGCLGFESVVQSFAPDRQILAGAARCAANANIDGTCSLSNNLVKIVETYQPATGYQCYPHGALTAGHADLYSVVRISAASSIVYAYINSVQQEQMSGFATTNANMQIDEWGEEAIDASHDSGCSGWSGFGSFTSWQRYGYDSGTWKTPVSSTVWQSCWSVGSLVSGGFNVSR